MTGLLASVQTTQDTAPLTWIGVLMAIAAMAVLATVVYLPALIAAYREHRQETSSR